LATFNRVFKSIVGVIPNEFRKQNDKVQNSSLPELAE